MEITLWTNFVHVGDGSSCGSACLGRLCWEQGEELHTDKIRENPKIIWLQHLTLKDNLSWMNLLQTKVLTINRLQQMKINRRHPKPKVWSLDSKWLFSFSFLCGWFVAFWVEHTGSTQARHVWKLREKKLNVHFLFLRTESSLGLVCKDCPHESDSGNELDLERELDLDYSR